MKKNMRQLVLELFEIADEYINLQISLEEFDQKVFELNCKR